MSAILEWFHSTGAKTGTTPQFLFTDLAAMFAANVGDANFSWEVASSEVVTTPLQITLKPKGGGIGRILFICYTSAPAGNNPAFLNGAPTINRFYTTFFPNGNVDTPSNLAASGGTVMGDDTDSLYVSAGTNISNMYAASVTPYYFDSAEGVVLFTQNPISTTIYSQGAGYLFVDASDNVYPSNFGFGQNNANLWQGSGPMNWASGNYLPTNTNARARVNYGGNNRQFFNAWLPTGLWANSTAGNSMLIDTGSSQAFFVPVSLLGQLRGEGFVLKWRQIAFGPPTTGAFATVTETGPTIVARQAYSNGAGSTGAMWFINSKI